jgi:pyrimidine-specific ribonucleoside hydrolase
MEIQPDTLFKNFLEVSYQFKSKWKVDSAIKALQGWRKGF